MDEDSEVDSRGICQELVDFYARDMPSIDTKDKVVVRRPAEHTLYLQEWARHLASVAKGQDKVDKVLLRLGIATEQLNVVLLGIINEWEIFRGEPLTTNIHPELLMPLLTYWEMCRVYAIQQFMEESVDPLATEILDIMKQLINPTGNLKPRTKRAPLIRKHNAVMAGDIMHVFNNRGGNSKVMRNLKSLGDAKNITLRIQQLLKALVDSGEVIEVIVPGARKAHYGFPDN